MARCIGQVLSHVRQLVRDVAELERRETVGQDALSEAHGDLVAARESLEAAMGLIEEWDEEQDEIARTKAEAGQLRLETLLEEEAA